MVVFCRLVCRPETSPKFKRMRLRLSTSMDVGFRKVTASSAYMETQNVEFGKQPLICGNLKNTLERVNSQDEEKGGEWVPLAQSSAMLYWFKRHPVEQYARSRGRVLKTVDVAVFEIGKNGPVNR
jgi:hypothetical protein